MRPRPAKVTSRPRYDGCRTQRYGPSLTTCWSAATRTTVVNHRPSATTAQARIVTPTTTSVAPTTYGSHVQGSVPPLQRDDACTARKTPRKIPREITALEPRSRRGARLPAVRSAIHSSSSTNTRTATPKPTPAALDSNGSPTTVHIIVVGRGSLWGGSFIGQPTELSPGRQRFVVQPRGLSASRRILGEVGQVLRLRILT
jgi:hypothetical protein